MRIPYRLDPVSEMGIYIPRDEHLDLRGHELVADAIVEWLADREPVVTARSSAVVGRPGPR